MTYCKACRDAADGFYGSYAPLCPLHGAAKKLAAPQMVQVPLAFVQAFQTLVHNYSLEVVPPDFYHGVEKDAYRSAFRRCGQELAEAAKLLGTIK